MCDILQDEFYCESDSLKSESEVSKRCVPTQTQIRQQMGPKLSDVFFEYVGNEGKAYLGLEPPLEGPEVMWINPDARINNNVRITPLPEPAVLHEKVFTHQTILELGEDYILKLQNQHRLEMEEALKKQAKELEEECVRRLDDITCTNNNEANGHCKKVVATLMQHFDNCFNDLATTLRLRLRKEYQLRAEEERAEVASHMLTLMEEEMRRRDLELCAEFHDILSSELNQLSCRYKKQINNEREMAVQLIRDTVKNYEKLIRDVRTEMEINNFVDLCRSITQERVACRKAVEELSKKAKSRQEELVQCIEGLKAENFTLKHMSNERQQRLVRWRWKVRKLLHEFQRYINFAMKSVPGQTQFMLDIKALLLRSYPEDSFLNPEDYLEFLNFIKDKSLPKEEIEVIKPEVCQVKTESTEEEKSEVGSGSGISTPSYLDQDDAKRALTFDYKKFKGMLVQKYASDLVKDVPRKKPKKPARPSKKKSKQVSIDTSCELYQLMTVAGEEEKEHLAPLDCFLYGRLNAIKNICQDDPEFATVILGCSKK